MLVPYHSFKKKDAMALVPGQIAELKFGLQPISTLIRKGHRLRIAPSGFAARNTPRCRRSTAKLLITLYTAKRATLFPQPPNPWLVYLMLISFVHGFFVRNLTVYGCSVAIPCSEGPACKHEFVFP